MRPPYNQFAKTIRLQLLLAFSDRRLLTCDRSDLSNLIEDRNVMELLALGVRSGRVHGAALAIGCYHNSASDGDLSTFLSCEFHRAIIDFPVRAHVRGRIPGDGIIFPVESAGPFALSRLTFFVRHFDRYFCL